MTLNIDCVRDVLLEFETFPMGHYFVDSFSKSIEKYSYDDVLYCLLKLAEAGYINAKYYRDMNGCPHIELIYDLTFAGHEFLADIKPKSNWEKLSSAAKQGGGASLKALGNTALDLGVDLLKTRIGLK